MIVLGIDPRVATIGFGVIRAERQKNTLIQYGVITTPPGIPLSNRLLQISNDMEELIRTFHPDEMAVEELFFTKNITTGIAVAHARGVLLYTAEKCGIPLHEYTPSQVKMAVVGYGKAEKRQVMDMTRRLLHLKAVPRPDDAADALALALCRRLLEKDGAWRVHGGGFAGTIQAFVPLDLLERFRKQVEACLGDGSCHVLSIRPVGGTVLWP